MAESKVIQLPPEMMPLLVRVVTDHPMEPGNRLTWALRNPHPVIPDMRVVRMYLDEEGLGVFSVWSDGRDGAAHHKIPRSDIRLTEEIMPLHMLREEIEAAEYEEDEEEDGDDNAESSETEADDSQTPAPNGAPNAQS